MTFNTQKGSDTKSIILGFKPYYKWMTFNTIFVDGDYTVSQNILVLNLIING